MRGGIRIFALVAKCEAKERGRHQMGGGEG